MMSLPTMTRREHQAPHPEVIVMASRLELRRHRDVVSFLVAALRLRRTFRSARGGITLALRAEPLRRRFWTLSTWTDDGALRAFTADPAHVAVMHRFRDRMAGSSFVSWTEREAAVPSWTDAAELLADAPPRSGP